MTEQFDRLRQAYIEELYRRYNDPNDPDYGPQTRREYSAPATLGTSREAATIIADKMLASVARGNTPGNQKAMMAAGRKVGLKTSPEVRTVVKGELGSNATAELRRE
jgi:hypothetical protein